MPASATDSVGSKWIVSGWYVWSRGVRLSTREFFLDGSFDIAFTTDVSCPGRTFHAPDEKDGTDAVSSITCRFRADCPRS